jgi:hypothetical protein
MTPPNSVGGDGTYLPSMVVVALVEHGTPVACWAVAADATDRNSRSRRTGRTWPWSCQNFFLFLIEVILPL